MPSSFGRKVSPSDLAKLNGMELAQGVSNNGIKMEEVNDQPTAADTAYMKSCVSEQSGKFPQKGANNKDILDNC